MLCRFESSLFHNTANKNVNRATFSSLLQVRTLSAPSPGMLHWPSGIRMGPRSKDRTSNVELDSNQRRYRRSFALPRIQLQGESTHHLSMTRDLIPHEQEIRHARQRPFRSPLVWTGLRLKHCWRCLPCFKNTLRQSAKSRQSAKTGDLLHSSSSLQTDSAPV